MEKYNPMEEFENAITDLMEETTQEIKDIFREVMLK